MEGVRADIGGIPEEPQKLRRACIQDALGLGVDLPPDATELNHREPRLLRQFAPRQLLRGRIRNALPRTLRELPEALPDRMPVLLDQPHDAVRDGGDQRRGAHLDPAVEAGRAVGALEPILVQPDPAVLVDDARRHDAHAVQPRLRQR